MFAKTPNIVACSFCFFASCDSSSFTLAAFRLGTLLSRCFVQLYLRIKSTGAPGLNCLARIVGFTNTAALHFAVPPIVLLSIHVKYLYKLLIIQQLVAIALKLQHQRTFQ
jgi:hypothetical protein